jgi:hypothetical protein
MELKHVLGMAAISFAVLAITSRVTMLRSLAGY